MTELKVGSVVQSLNGRDRGRIMAVVSLDGKSVFTADGRMRKVASPKRKNPRHLKLLSHRDFCIAVDAELTNKRLWKALEPFRNSDCSKNKNDLI